jgi:putative transposase
MSVHVDPSGLGELEQAELSQPYVDLTGEMVVIGGKYDSDARFYRVQEALAPIGDHPRQWLLQPRETGARSLLLTDAQIVAMEARGQFRHAFLHPGSGLMDGRAPTIALLDPEAAKGALLKVYWLRKYAATKGFVATKARFDAFLEDERNSGDAPDPVSFSTVYREYTNNEASLYGDPEGVAAPKQAAGGRPRDPWGPAVVKLLHEAMWKVFPRRKYKARDVLDELTARAAEHGIPEDGLPKLRTVQERIREVPKVVRDILRLGYDKAVAKHGHTEVRLLPDRPLEVVEADEVQMDVEVLDDVTLINLGRPWLLMILDRRTGIVLSAVLGFSPSFALFTKAVRMAMYPKDMSAYEGLSYPYYGLWEAIDLDGASWYRGEQLDRMRLNLGFDVVELTPGAPREKGAAEALNKHVNERVAHNLPGAVMGSPQEREEYEDTLVPPLIRLSELQFLVYDWICNERNVKPVEGLGPFRRLKAVPAVLWKQHIHKARSRRPIDVDIFDKRFGPVEWRTIQDEGIRIDHLIYWSDELHWLRSHKEHKPGKGKHQGTKYQCIRDPNDLGLITVVNPYWKPARGADRARGSGPAEIVCRVVPAHRDYADGLPLAVHDKFVTEYNAQVKQDARTAQTPDRQKIKALEVADKARRMRQDLGLDGLFARFMKGQRARRIASEIRPATTSSAASAGMLDVRAPPSVPPTQARSPHAPPGPPDPKRPAFSKRRSAETARNVREAGRGTTADPGAPLSNLSIDLEDELNELTQLRNQEDKP